MNLLDSRRLTGPSLVLFEPGAIIDAEAEAGESVEDFLAAWSRHARTALDTVGWSASEVVHRVFSRGFCVALSAPVDALYAATEVNEWAFEQAKRELAGEGPEDISAALERLTAEIEEELNPRLVGLTREAAARDVTCLRDDDELSLGLGKGSRTWPVSELPTRDEVDWDALHDIPLALVTGTNGKSTTVRMLASIARAGGRAPGLSSTDRIEVNGRCLEEGDWSGPGGARRILRETEVEVALLETARGGLLRRGLAVERADVAVVTNVAADHLGEWCVGDVEELADAKLVVARAAQQLVLNADDPVLAARAAQFEGPVTWFSLDPDSTLVAEASARGETCCVLDGEDLVLRELGENLLVARAAELPSAMGGAARFNLSNALAAIAAARVLGFELRAIHEGLVAFRSDPEDNPGRLNLFERDGTRVLVDFAHNPHGLSALLEMARTMKPGRLLVGIGQAGDRDDDSILELARVTAAAKPDRVLVKTMSAFLRGREEGVVAKMLETELLAGGMQESALERADDELDAAQRAVAWSKPGDLLLLTCHTQREELIAQLRADGFSDAAA